MATVRPGAFCSRRRVAALNDAFLLGAVVFVALAAFVWMLAPLISRV